jgi:hypothetical protein
MTRYSSLSLTEIVCLCANEGGDEVWQEFVSRVSRPISLTIMRTASRWGQPSKPLVEDLVQVTYLKLWEGGCLCDTTPGRDFGIFEEHCRQCHPRLFQTWP